MRRGRSGAARARTVPAALRTRIAPLLPEPATAEALRLALIHEPRRSREAEALEAAARPLRGLLERLRHALDLAAAVRIAERLLEA